MKYDTHVELRKRINKEFQLLDYIDEVNVSEWSKFGEKGKVAAGDFENPIHNYYLTNSICRASDTMKACSKEFQAQHDDYLEAAE